MNKDLLSTMGGGLSGMGILATVRWDAVPNGECVKVGVALFLIVVSYFAYRRDPGGKVSADTTDKTVDNG